MDHRLFQIKCSVRKKMNARVLALMLVGCFSLAGCARAPEAPSPPTSFESLVTALATAGVEARQGGQSGADVLGLASRDLWLGGEQIWVYSSTALLTEEQVRNAFSEITAQRFIWANEYLIILYDGRDGGTVLTLDGLLGEPLMRPEAAGDEPYPPAIPAAIRIAAEGFGLPPGSIEVVDYQSHEWSDTCLEIPAPGEQCAEQLTPGWVITLLAGEIMLDVHSDSLGENVRWIVK